VNLSDRQLEALLKAARWRVEQPYKEKPRSRRGLAVWRVQEDIEHAISVRPFYDGLRAAQWRGERSLDLLKQSAPPSPPAEKATARQDQTGQASTGDGAGTVTASSGKSGPWP
jgi:hypothetical protein